MANKDINVKISVQDNASKTIKGISGAFSGMKDAAGKISAIGGVALGGMTIALNKTINDASKLKNSLVGLKSIVQGTGNSFDKATDVVQRFTADGLVSTEEAATSLKNLLAKGFSLDQAEQMMIRFKDAAAFGRQSALGLGEAIAGATEGIKNENSMLVDNAGVTKNVSVMVTEYAKSLGIKETALTASQKNEAVYQGILKETRFQLGDAAKLSNEYSGQVAKLDAQQLQLSQTIGATLMPIMSDLYSKLTPIITSVTDWIKENPKLTQTIIVVSESVAALITAIGLLGLAIPSIITGFGLFVVAAKALGAALLFLVSNPIGLTITAITALGLSALYVYNNWESIRPKLQAVWTAIGGTIAYAVNTAKTATIEAFDYIKSKVLAVTEWLGGKVETVMSYASKIKKSLESVGSSVYQATHDENGNFSVSGARANGGPVSSGSTYLVGERGPELFTPSRSGSIVSNESLASSGSGSININMGGITISNAADADALIDRVKTSLIREIKLARKGLYV